MTRANGDRPVVGFGVRTRHYDDVLARGISVPFVEVITENFLGRGGRPRAVLERLARDAEVALHGVSLSLGGLDPLPLDRLRALRTLADDVGASIVSDHACFGSVGGHTGHDLWPLPFTEECIMHLATRIRAVQDALGRRILIENVSSYVTYAVSDITEWEFLRAVCEESGCGLLLDVNNVYVNAVNHGFSAETYLDAIPPHLVGQVHLADHRDLGTHLLDDHGGAPRDVVLDLYERVLARTGPVRTLLEWDTDPPDVDTLTAACARIQRGSVWVGPLQLAASW